MYPTELASGYSKYHVPFSQLAGNVSTYIDPRYLPDGIAFKDPRNMVKPHILAFCNHIRKRQERHGVADAFLFKRYHDGTHIVSAEYGRRFDKEKDAERIRKQTRSRQSDKRAKLKGKQKETLPVGLNTDERFITSPRHHPQSSNQAEGSSRRTQVVDASRHIPEIDPALTGIDPALANPILSVPTHAVHSNEETVIVGDSVMQKLVAAGHQPIQPFNGPQDGAPMYYIAASALRLLESQGKTKGANAEAVAAVAARPQRDVLPPPITQTTSNRQLRSRPSKGHVQNLDPSHAEGSSGRTLRSHGRPDKERGKKKSGKQ